MSIWLSVSEKTVVLALKPTVFALAMLLPVTSSMVWLTRRPLMPAKSERSMVVPLDGWVLLDGGWWWSCRSSRWWVVLVVADAAAAVPALTDWTWFRATWLSPTSSIGPSVPKVTPVTLPVWVAP